MSRIAEGLREEFGRMRSELDEGRSEKEVLRDLVRLTEHYLVMLAERTGEDRR